MKRTLVISPFHPATLGVTRSAPDAGLITQAMLMDSVASKAIRSWANVEFNSFRGLARQVELSPDCTFLMVPFQEAGDPHALAEGLAAYRRTKFCGFAWHRVVLVSQAAKAVSEVKRTVKTGSPLFKALTPIEGWPLLTGMVDGASQTALASLIAGDGAYEIYLVASDEPGEITEALEVLLRPVATVTFGERNFAAEAYEVEQMVAPSKNRASPYAPLRAYERSARLSSAEGGGSMSTTPDQEPPPLPTSEGIPDAAGVTLPVGGAPSSDPNYAVKFLKWLKGGWYSYLTSETSVPNMRRWIPASLVGSIIFKESGGKIGARGSAFSSSEYPESLLAGLTQEQKEYAQHHDLGVMQLSPGTGTTLILSHDVHKLSVARLIGKKREDLAFQVAAGCEIWKDYSIRVFQTLAKWNTQLQSMPEHISDPNDEDVLMTRLAYAYGVKGLNDMVDGYRAKHGVSSVTFAQLEAAKGASQWFRGAKALLLAYRAAKEEGLS